MFWNWWHRQTARTSSFLGRRPARPAHPPRRLSVEALEDRRLLATLYAVTDSNRLISFDDQAPGTLLSDVAITGLPTGTNIIDIDFRPSTGVLYALGVDFSGPTNSLFTIERATGTATQVGTGFDFAGITGQVMDFDPATDQIRVFVDASGTPTLETLDPNTGAPVGGSTLILTNAVEDGLAFRPDATLFGTGFNSPAVSEFLRTVDLNDGTVTDVGNMGITFVNGFDIDRTAAAFVVGGTSTADELYSVDLATGATTDLGLVGSGLTLRGLSVLEVPSISIADATPIDEGNSGTTPVLLDVTLSNVFDEVITVEYFTQDGTATATDNDYVPVFPATLTFAPGQTSQPILVDVVGDIKFEQAENFFVNLVNPSPNATLLDDQGTATILNDDTQPTVSIGDPTANEGDSGTTPFAFLVTLSNASFETITVEYFTTDSTATAANNDYVPVATGTLTFLPDQTSQTILIDVNGDINFETDENFFVNLANPTRATLGTDSAAGNILNDDPRPSFSINNVSANEGDSGQTPFTFAVTLDRTSVETITIAYTTVDQSATAGTDYDAASGTLTFAPGQTSQNIVVNVNGDINFETDETFLVNLSGAVNTTNAAATGTGTILNDDPRPSFSINNVSANEGDSGQTPFTFAVTLDRTSVETITIAYTTVDQSATTGDSDYVAASGTLTFLPGQTSQNIIVNANGDTKFETDETFLVNLSGAVNTTNSAATGTGTIVNDDPRPTFSIGNVSANEGNSGQTPFTFTVNLSNASAETITISYTTVDQSATASDNDFVAVQGTLTFLPDQTSQTIVVTVNGDTKFETDETFLVNLSGAVNTTNSAATGTGTIVNDDVRPTYSIANVSANEGNSGQTPFTFAVNLSNASFETITINYTTANGTATTADNDYTAVSGTLTFLPNQTGQTIVVNVTGDTKFETNETFLVNLSNGVNTTTTSASATGTIVNDDLTPPTVSIGNVSANEGNSGNTPFTFTVRLSEVSGVTATVAYSTSNGSATTADNDYAATSGTVTIAPGQTTATIVVNVVGDTRIEPNETFQVTLSSPTGATLGSPSTGTATIVNDDVDDANTSWLKAVYCKLLDRVPPTEELAFWRNLLNSGVPRTVIANAIGTSAERKQVIIRQFYETFLERTPSQGEVNFWAGQLVIGGNEAQIVAAFLTSAEYTSLHPSNADFVTSAIEQIFDVDISEVDPSLVATLINLLNTGARTRQQVVFEILASDEAYEAAVEENYEEILGRSADPAGAAYWIGQVASGQVTPVGLTSLFLASDEFFSQAPQIVEDCLSS